MLKGKLSLRFDIRTLKGAEYNPRRIDAETFAKLRESVSTLGCVKPIIVRKDTIVAGHQRTKAMIAEGIHWAPVYQLGTDASTYDEVRFNQLHNGTDIDYGTELAYIDSKCINPGWVYVTAEKIKQRTGGTTSGAKVRNEILRLVSRYGAWGSCVATMDGEIFHASQYALACKQVGEPVLTYVVPREVEQQAKAALGRGYGVFSYDHLPKQTFIQTLAQLPRLTGDKRDNRSPTYETLIIPWFQANLTDRGLDFGCGKGDYVERLSKKGIDLIGMEFFRRKRENNSIDVASVNRMVDALVKRLVRKGLFDVVVCDYVLNSVDSVQAEHDVMTCVNAFCRIGGSLFISGRRREQVDNALKSDRAINQTLKRGIEFLDGNGFSSMYRQGRWFYQKFHTHEQAARLVERFGFEILKHEETHSGFQIHAKKISNLQRDYVVAGIGREFNMPLNDDGRRLGRHDDVIEAYERVMQ
jgi:ParB family transcriptional regulator, chromosome partitioning protein